MRIAHLADTHLGYRHWHYSGPEGRNARETDVYDAFHQAIDKAIDLEVDAVIHAGDLFEVTHPSTYALGQALDGFARLRDVGIPAVVIAGNHSTPTTTATAHVFSLLRRFGTHAVFAEPERIRLGELAVTGVPHVADREAMLAQITAAEPDPAADFNVLVVHVGLERLPGAGSREVSVVELDPDALQAAADFDYVALGHLHGFAPISLNAAYAGSLERLGFYDDAPKKGFALVDLARPGTRDFVRLIEVDTRFCKQLPELDVAGKEDIFLAIRGALDGLPLSGSAMRLPITGVEQSAWRALDRRALRELTKECLHFEAQPEFAGTDAPVVGGHVDLGAFVAEYGAKDLDSSQLFERATGYMDRAAADLQEVGDA